MSDTSDPAKPDFSKLKIRDKEFNDESMQQITAWYKYYGDLFLESEIAQKLPAEVQEEFPFIVSSFSDFCYSYHLQKPGQWNKKAVHEVCAYIMPRKVMGNEAFFKSIIPGMSAFLQWAEHQEILTKTTDLRKALQSSENELLSNSTNPNHWGIGKSLFMGAEASGVDFGNQNDLESFIDNYNKNITIPSSNEKLIRREPKQTNEIHTLEDILEDLSFLLSGFPQAAIEAAINKKDEITPILLDTLDDALNHYDSLEDDDLSPLYAIYLLAKFREKQGFPKIMDILHLPEADSEKILGPDEVTGYAIKNIIASTFNGDLQRIYQLAEDKNAFEYARATAIESLLPLYTSGQISYETVIEYYRYLIESGLEKPHLLLWSILACSIIDLHATELYEPMKAAFQAGLVDPEFVRLNDFEKHFLQSKESVHAEKLYYHYHLVEDVVKEMSWWACFKDEEAPAHSNNNLMDTMSWEPNTTIHRELPKVGKNDTCPCGSGKKYKKCCLD